jgi:hypothetical protein
VLSDPALDGVGTSLRSKVTLVIAIVAEKGSLPVAVMKLHRLTEIENILEV